MADDTQNKSELPTPRRREEARKQGQVALSSELTGGVLLLSGILVLSFVAPDLGSRLMALFRLQLGYRYYPTWSLGHTRELAVAMSRFALLCVGGILLGGLLTGLAVSLLQTGLRFSSEVIAVKWSRLSPAKGVQRLFSLRSVVRTVLGLTKLVSVSAAVIWALHARGTLADSWSLRAAVASGWKTAVFAALVATGVLTVIGVIDYAFQRWQHEQDLRMSRREVQEEHKQEEGDPQIKSRVRKLQREASKQRMLREVPKASVVLTNPTHIAVAIRYERGAMPAPQVIAKGDGLLAKRIVRLAREHDIPVLERKPLARALFAAVEIGQEIPAVLYQAIAEILAYVYRLSHAKGA